MAKKIIGALDIGGTKIKSALFEDGVPVKTAETDTLAREGGAPAVLERAQKLLQSLGAFSAAGISTAGQVEPDTGKIRYANENLPGYTGTDVKGYFEGVFGCPAAVVNDVCAAALGEGAFGAAKHQRDYLCLTLGTGVGGALVLNGSLYYGAGPSAGGMVGGMILHPEERLSGEFFSGTFEQLASTTGLVKSALLVDSDLTDGRKIFARMKEPAVKQVIDNWLDMVAVGVTNLIHLFNVPWVVIGGGVTEQPHVSREIGSRVEGLLIPGFQGVKVVSAKLGNTAGLYGACSLAEKLLL